MRRISPPNFKLWLPAICVSPVESVEALSVIRITGMVLKLNWPTTFGSGNIGNVDWVWYLAQPGPIFEKSKLQHVIGMVLFLKRRKPKRTSAKVFELTV